MWPWCGVALLRGSAAVGLSSGWREALPGPNALLLALTPRAPALRAALVVVDCWIMSSWRAAAMAAMGGAALLVTITATVTSLLLPPPEADVVPDRAQWAADRAPSWWETMAPGLSDKEFRSHFRACWATFHYIVDAVGDAVEAKTTGWRAAIPRDKVVAIALYRLATGHDYRSCGLFFGVATSIVGVCVDKVVRALASPAFAGLHIRFPTIREEYDANALAFNRLVKDGGGMLGIVSAVDGSHVAVRYPDSAEGHADWRNRKGYMSYNVMAAVDVRSRFLFVNASWPGSVGDARVCANSWYGRAHANGTAFGGPTFPAAAGLPCRTAAWVTRRTGAAAACSRLLRTGAL